MWLLDHNSHIHVFIQYLPKNSCGNGLVDALGSLDGGRRDEKVQRTELTQK